MRALALAVLVAVTAALAAAPAAPAARKAPRAKLLRFDDCRELTAFARDRFVRADGTVGVPFRGPVLRPAVLAGPQVMPTLAAGQPMPASAPAAERQTAAGDTGGDFSQTNVQEQGVDEPDIVKTDGPRLYVASGGQLRVFDVTGPEPRLLGRLALPGTGHQLLLRGGRLLVIASAADALPGDGPGMPIATSIAPYVARVLLTEVDVTDPAAPRVARTMDLAGLPAGARMVGGTVRVVVASEPAPVVAEGPAVARQARRATLRRFLPRTTIRSRITGRTYRRSVVPCERVRRPRAFGGLGLTSVLTIDLDKGLFSVARDAVLASAQEVYASASTLVVVSRRWADVPLGSAPSGGRTELHVFDAGAEARTAYRGSGTVPGFILNQFALSEHEGVLRVATTEDAPWGPQGPVGQSESSVTVLRHADGRWVTAGRVTGLGKGERIYAVRFLGERGYVVTFRQVDPLYVIDLRDPSAPRAAGELKVSGYSAYLHPLSETRLLGVGQDATDQGRTSGTQVSLFDVGDPARPRLVSRASLGGATSSAEQDHHAFLWWAPERLAVLPLDAYRPEDDRWFSGAVGFRVTDDAVGELGRIEHPASGEAGVSPPIGRSIVIGDRLLTLSIDGIATNRLRDLAPLAFTPLG